MTLDSSLQTVVTGRGSVFSPATRSVSRYFADDGDLLGPRRIEQFRSRREPPLEPERFELELGLHRGLDHLPDRVFRLAVGIDRRVPAAERRRRPAHSFRLRLRFGDRVRIGIAPSASPSAGSSVSDGSRPVSASEYGQLRCMTAFPFANGARELSSVQPRMSVGVKPPA